MDKARLERKRLRQGGPDPTAGGEWEKVETQSSFCGELDKFLTSLDLGKHSASLSEQEFDLTTIKSMSKKDNGGRIATWCCHENCQLKRGGR